VQIGWVDWAYWLWRSRIHLLMTLSTAVRLYIPAHQPEPIQRLARRFRCGSLLLAADSAHKWTIVHFLRQGCRRALVRWNGAAAVAMSPQSIVLGASWDSAKRQNAAVQIYAGRQARARSTSSPGEPAAV
jgi:hypothetical protein